MVNPHKGEVEFKVGNVAYTLSFSANAICEAEEHFGRDPGLVLGEAIGAEQGKTNSLRVLREMFWLGLSDHHPEIDFEAAKKLLKSLSPRQMAELVVQALALAMPETTANPPVPGGPDDGTGPASSTDGSRQDSMKPFFGG
jgi:hypothetical protein